MAKMFSHSKISSYEQCKFKYKLRYIDKIKPEVEKSIEALLGTCVHNALEWLYLQVKEGIISTLDEVIVKYTEEWKNNYSENILIVKKENPPEFYFNRGIEFLIYYHTQNYPFDDGTLELEKRIFLDVDAEGAYKVQGYIDRLAFNSKTKEFEIHDYKTAKTLPTQNKMEKDRQLALYSIAIKDLYGHEKEVKLVWHYLAHKQTIEVRKTNDQLKQLKAEIHEIIRTIESTTDFPPTKSILCSWCEYKSMCPAWGNKAPVQEKKKPDVQLSLENYPTASKYIRE